MAKDYPFLPLSPRPAAADVAAAVVAGESDALPDLLLPASPLLARIVRRTMPGPITLVADVDDAPIQRKLAALKLPAERAGHPYVPHTNST